MIAGDTTGSTSLPLDSTANVDSWILSSNRSCNLPQLPFRVRSHASAITPIGLVICGGFRIPGGDQKTCKRLTSSNQWEYFPSLKTFRWDLAMKYMNGKLWAIGGHGSLSMEYIDITNPTLWTTESIPFDSRYGSCITELPNRNNVNNRLLLIGGGEWNNLVVS